MPNLLERYLAGDQIATWAELGALGARVREEPFYADALAVARETMSRARHNIELLVARLNLLGYRFGYDWWDNDFLDMLADDPPPPVFISSSMGSQRQLATMERQIGPLPLSLYTWYEQVGAVNFVGRYPVEDPTDPDGFTGYLQFVESGGRSKGRRFAQETCDHDLDPLFIYSLDYSLARFLQRSTSLPMSGGAYEIEIAPDEWLKYGVSGSGSYSIKVPNAGADAILENEWHETTFVNYLRICFRWGGFPGLACKSRKPEKELAFLTRDLLPI